MLIRSVTLALVLALTTTVSADGCGTATPGTSSSPGNSRMTAATPFVVLMSAQTSGFDESAELVVRDAPAFAVAWSTAHSGVAGNPPPAVDFEHDMVIVLAIGARRTGGFAVQFDSISAGAGAPVVRYTVTSPGPGCMTTLMLTSPVQIVRVRRMEGAVQFQRRDKTEQC